MSLWTAKITPPESVTDIVVFSLLDDLQNDNSELEYVSVNMYTVLCSYRNVDCMCVYDKKSRPENMQVTFDIGTSHCLVVEFLMRFLYVLTCQINMFMKFLQFLRLTTCNLHVG